MVCVSIYFSFGVGYKIRHDLLQGGGLPLRANKRGVCFFEHVGTFLVRYVRAAGNYHGSNAVRKNYKHDINFFNLFFGKRQPSGELLCRALISHPLVNIVKTVKPV